MEIKKIVSFCTDENCYLIYNGKEGILIDPGSDYEKIYNECKNIDIKYIFLTHCHYDHLMGLEYIKNITKAKVVSGKKCQINMQDKFINVSYLFGDEKVFSPSDITLEDNEVFPLDFADVECIYTPGHTDCSVCYKIENHIFTGDTLFKLSVGRWDLPTGDNIKISNSLKERLYSLDDDLIVHPGHGADSSIGYEKKHNLYVKAEK